MNKTVSAQAALALSGGRSAWSRQAYERRVDLSCATTPAWLLVASGMVVRLWGPHARANSFASLHPYAALFADAVAVASWLVILGGLWFFRRSARLIFVLVLAVGVVYSALAAPPLQVSAALICFLHQLIYCHAGWCGRCNLFSTASA
jgi:hypothetical protein